MRREDRSSISSHPHADPGWKLLIGLRHRLLLISPSSCVRAKGRSFIPTRRTSIASRAGAVKPAVALGLRLAPTLPGRALTAPSTVRGLPRSDDACLVGPRQLEGASFGPHRPGDAGKLVGKRDRQHVVVQAPLGGHDPGLEPVTFPVLDLDPVPPDLTGPNTSRTVLRAASSCAPRRYRANARDRRDRALYCAVAARAGTPNQSNLTPAAPAGAAETTTGTAETTATGPHRPTGRARTTGT